MKLFYIVFVAFSVLFSFSAWRGITSAVSTWLSFAGALALFLTGAGLALQSFTTRIVLSDDSIRFGSIFHSQVIRLDQISYRREYEEYQDGADGGINVSYLEFVSRDSEVPSLKISKDDFDLDHPFWEWALRVPEFEDLSS